MNRQEAIKVLKEDRYLYESDIVSAGDGSPDGDLLLAIDMAVAALEKQIEIEKAQFTHICKSEAIKEFVEKLTDKISVYSKYVDVDGIVILNRIFRMIEDIEKEMTEVQE